MGDHYVPQYYLSGFSPDGRSIWVYDKVQERKFGTQIKSIANENSFYSPEVENYLANCVEGPANGVLKKIRQKEAITQRDKETLSAYMVCMMKRVPQGRSRVKKFAPSVANRIGAKIDEKLKNATIAEPSRAEFFEKRWAEVQEVLERFSRELPKEIWLTNIPPERSPQTLAALSRMTWRFFVSDRGPSFLTSDNPVFYFTTLGIGRPQSEVTFPISSTIALWATWRQDIDEVHFIPAKESVVKELNRRTASLATRYMFHSKNEPWVLSLLTRATWRLNRLT